MRRSDIIWSADQPDQADEISFGFKHLPGRLPPGGGQRARWWMIAAAAAAAVAALIAVVPGNGRTWPPRLRLPFGVTDLGHPLLGVRAGWELYGYGAGGVIRIQFARGRVTRTAVPGLASNGPLTFLTGGDEAIIRPIDHVPGYAVPDGQRARTLSGELSQGGTVLPGPSQGTVWVQPSFGSTTMPLVRLDGRATGVTLHLPWAGPWLADPDGRGFVLLSPPGQNRFYDLRPGHVRKIAGWLAAVGPTRWLMVGCPTGRCANAVVDPVSGARRTLPGPPLTPGYTPGVISPDGTTAAAMQTTGHRVTLRLVDLASGAERTIAIPLNLASPFGSTLAWSPDSRWLFAVTATGSIAAIDARTHQVDPLGIPLPPITQLAIQPPQS